MRDVAVRAGVSGQTVSRVVHGRDNVDQATRERVLAAMHALGYRPNRAARALRTGTSHSIGVIVTSLAAIGNSRLLEAMATQAAERGYVVIVQAVGDAPDSTAVDTAMKNLLEHAVDGIVVANEASRWVHDDASPVPLVLIDAQASAAHHVVMTDHYAGSRDIVALLTNNAASTVHHIAGPSDSFAAAERERAWRDVGGEHAPVPEPERGDWSSASGYQAARNLIARREAGERVTAIFAANDQMAIGALRALHEAGLRVPQDVAVAGFDGNPDSAFLNPPLTTAAQDFAGIARAALAGIVEARSDGAPVIIAPTLQVRESAG